MLCPRAKHFIRCLVEVKHLSEYLSTYFVCAIRVVSGESVPLLRVA